MNEKIYEVKKGKGKKAYVGRIIVKNDEDLKTLGMFLYYGWQVKEVKGATV